MNHPIRTALVLSAAPLLAAPPPESPFSTPQPAFYGQVRPRLELDHKALADTAHSFSRTLLRSRLGFTAVTSEFSEVRVEIQDARVLGSEPAAGANQPSATTGNAKGVDLTQGYGALEFLFGEDMALKTAVGRMKMSLGAGRFLSTLEWSATARQLDGVASNFRKASLDVTGFAFMIRDTSTATAPVFDAYHALYGLYGSLPVLDTLLQAEAGVFYDRSRMRTSYPTSPVATDNYDLWYLDGRIFGKAGFVAWEQELLWQGGEALSQAGIGLSSAAFYSASRIGIVLPAGKLNLGVDIMSGDDKDDDELTQYRPNYYFGHAYFGWMDYFVSNPRYGVIDWRVDADVPLGDWGALKPQYHFFQPQKGKDVAGRSLDPYGHEIDAEIHVTRIPKTLLVFGAGVFLPGDGAYLLGTPVKLGGPTASTAPGYFFYVMPTFNF